MDFEKLLGEGSGPDWDAVELRQVQTGACDHEKIRMYCPCEKSCKPFIVCVKCHMVFCDEHCSDRCQNRGGTEGDHAHDGGKSTDRVEADEDLIQFESPVESVETAVDVSSEIHLQEDKDEVREVTEALSASPISSDMSATPINPEVCTRPKNPALRFVPASVIRASSKLPLVDKSLSKQARSPSVVINADSGQNSNKQASGFVGAVDTKRKSQQLCAIMSSDATSLIQPQLDLLSITDTEREGTHEVTSMAGIMEQFQKLSPKQLDPKDKKAFYSLTEIDVTGRVNIVPFSDHLYLEMLDTCMDCDDFDFLSAPPDVDSYVMSRFNESEQFYRALVKEVDGDKVTLSFLELGTEKAVPFDELKPPVLDAFTYPVLGYQGWLSEAQLDHNLIHPDDFLHFKSKKLTRYFSLKQVHLKDQKREFVLYDYRTDQSLSQEFNELKIWVWERLLMKCESGKDKDLIDRGGWGEKDTTLDSAEILLIPQGTELLAKYLHDTDIQTSFFAPHLTGDDFVKRSVLESQIKRYCQLVKSTEYYPTLSDGFIYFDGDYHHRCRRVSDRIINSLDTGDTFQLPNADDPVRFVRRMPPDFFRVPIGIIECQVDGGLSYEALKSSKNKTLRIRVERFNKDEFTYSVKILSYL